MAEDNTPRDLEEKKINTTLAAFWGGACYFFGLMAIGGLIYWNTKIQDGMRFGWLIVTGFIVIAITSFITGTLLFMNRTKKS